MTTIAVHRGWLSCDSRVSDENNSHHTDDFHKILTLSGGVLVGVAGEIALGMGLIRSVDISRLWTDSGPVLPLEWRKPLKTVEYLIHRPGDKVVYTSTAHQYCDASPVSGFVAIGSGAEAARTAALVLVDETDYPPKEISRRIIEYASRMDLGTGGKIRQIRLT